MKKILLIGDSIRIGYGQYVEFAFDGVAKVYYPGENCRISSYVIKYLNVWKKQLNLDDVDLVHFNAGIWDAIVMNDGKSVTSIEEYRENIGRICELIKILFPSAKIVFATTTPAKESDEHPFTKELNRQIEKYNPVAIEVAKSYGAEIDDLYSVVKAVPPEYYSDQVHLYSRPATDLISNKVISCIEESLGIKAARYDVITKYDQIREEARSHKKENIYK
ncbi:MAG: hypothetical protein IKZ25_01350 [Clostridia bacterium]|nr:hypothetical protein [Clostridia bacterium]